MRTPPGFIALLSPTTAFLLSVMCAASQAFSILAPEMPSPAGGPSQDKQVGRSVSTQDLSRQCQCLTSATDSTVGRCEMTTHSTAHIPRAVGAEGSQIPHHIVPRSSACRNHPSTADEASLRQV